VENVFFVGVCGRQDKLNVEAFSDPKVQGVTLYLSDFSRPVADKLMNGDIFSGRQAPPPFVAHLEENAASLVLALSVVKIFCE